MKVETGFGLSLAQVRWSDNYIQKLYEMFTQNVAKKYYEFEKNIEKTNISQNEILKKFISGYKNEKYGWGGKLGLICDIINEAEFGDTPPVFKVDTDIIYVLAVIPENEEERAKLITRKRIRAILGDYISPLICSMLNFDYVKIAYVPIK